MSQTNTTAPLKRPLAALRAHSNAQVLAGPPLYLLDFRGQQHLDSFRLQNASNFLGDVRVFATSQLRTMIDDGDTAAEAPVGLRKFKADVPTAED